MRTRKNIRLTGYDYSRDGVYFVTICSRERQNIFAHIGVGAPLACARAHNTPNPPDMNHETMIELSVIGKIIENQWNALPNQFVSVSLDEFIIMPNHVHGIVIIKQRAQASGAPTLGHVVRAFKSKCTNEYLNHIETNNLNTSGKIWQSSFYDQIIRNDESFTKIRNYIRNNPLTWEEDKNHISCNKPAAPDRIPGG